MEVLKMMVFCISYGCVTDHCVKSVQIGSYFWSVFSYIRTEYAYSVRIQKNTDQKLLHIWTLFTQWMLSLLLRHL